ncbi:hypothetical protein ACFPRL_21325 [Pseudoclavibacter helvolus]
MPSASRPVSRPSASSASRSEAGSFTHASGLLTLTACPRSERSPLGAGSPLPPSGCG